MKDNPTYLVAGFAGNLMVGLKRKYVDDQLRPATVSEGDKP